jgi:hypothetical protein
MFLGTFGLQPVATDAHTQPIYKYLVKQITKKKSQKKKQRQIKRQIP